MRSNVMYFSFGENEFVYDKIRGLFHIEREIPGIRPDDIVEISSRNYNRAMYIKPLDGRAIISIHVRPEKYMTVRICIKR